MSALKFLSQDNWRELPDTLRITIERPSPATVTEESIEFHATRILFLMKYTGSSRTYRIIGRMKIAKLDFFVRYPTYLEKAAKILIQELPHFSETYAPESRMIRFKYGPWDEKYYDIFAYLLSKGMIEIEPSKRGDVFKLTNKGKAAIEELEGPEFNEIVKRCKLTKRLFGSKTGTYMKNFIYVNFPEVVGKEAGEEI
jgi:hypothetical protein